MLKFLLTILILVGSVLFIGPVLAANPLSAAQGNLDTALAPVGLQKDVGTSIGTVVKALLSVVGTIFLILTIYAGVLWMTAQGESEKVEKSQGIIRSAVIGLFVVMAAYAITAFVTSKVGGVGGGAPAAITNTSNCTSGGGGCYSVGTCPNGTSLIGSCNDSTVSSNAVCCK